MIKSLIKDVGEQLKSHRIEYIYIFLNYLTIHILERGTIKSFRITSWSNLT